MANFIYIELDTTAPSSPSISIEGGATYATNQLVSLAISTTDGDTTGYQMKIWGDVDATYDTAVQTTKETSSWISYNNSKQVKLSSGDSSKNIYLVIRDDVHNESSQVSDDIILDMSIPIVSVTSPDVDTISKQSGKNIASFSFTSDSDFVEYKVKYVNSTGASHDTGALIPTTAGSTNTSGIGSFSASTPINVQITGTDLETASGSDGNHIIKVFVLDDAGFWSV
jgi:hypothetical protein